MNQRELGSFVLAALAGGIALSAPPAPARAQEREHEHEQERDRNAVEFRIPAGPAVAALPAFAHQARLTVLGAASVLAGVSTNEVRGRLAPGEALARLLDGTGLAARTKPNGSVLVVRAGAPETSTSAATAAPAVAAQETQEPALLRWDLAGPVGAPFDPADLERLADQIPKINVSARRAQQSAIERKKRAATSIDSIVADDVGALPDRNIGEVIARMAGVTINRGEFGEGINVNLRGNGADLTRVEIDGQGVRSAGGTDMNGGGDGRATEFRQLSSDLIKSVDVVKGATADMSEGSLGGSILIKTRSALEFDRPYFALRATASRNSLNRKTDPDLNLIAARKFLDGRLGALLNASAQRLTNESHQFQVSSNGQDGYMRAIDFDNSPQKTFSYHPETVDLGDPAASAPWASYGGWNAATPLEIVSKAAAAQTKQDCYAAFPALTTSSPALAGLSSTNKLNAINARNQEIASCLNQWNDINPALLRYFVKRQADARRNLDLRFDFKPDARTTLYAKASAGRRDVDDNTLVYSLGNVSVNADGKFADSAAGVRSAVAGSGYFTFPYAFSLAGGRAPLAGAVANIDPASVVVDANHHVVRYTLQNANVVADQSRNRMGTGSRYLQLGGSFLDGPWSAEFMAGDMRSTFWRGEERAAFGYSYGNATVALQPNGIWAYLLPAGTDLNDWSRVTTLQPAASGSQAQYTTATGGISYNPQLRATAERTAKLDLAYSLRGKLPSLERIKAGFKLGESGSDYWGAGGYTVSPAVGGVAAVTVPGNKLSSTFVGCEGASCAYGINGGASSRNYQIVLTQQQFKDAVLASIGGTATPTRLFDGAARRPDTLVDNWPQIDVDKLYALVGAKNLNFDCVKTCTGSDGKVYEQPKTSLRERTAAAYLTGDFEFDHLPFGWELQGNLGWRYVRTRVAGTGSMTFISKRKTAQFDPANTGAAAGYTTSQLTRNTTLAASAGDLMPFLNLGMWLVPERLVLRYGRAKQVARPGASLLAASGTCTYDETRIDGPGELTAAMGCTSTLGNPALRPRTNLNHDLSLEWYPNKDMFFSAAAYKQIGKVGAPVAESVDGVKLFAGTATVDPATGVSLADVPFDVKTWVNGPPATRTGVELSAKAAFGFLPGVLRYTGADANATRQHSNETRTMLDLLSGEVLPPKGEPRYSFNWALWYDDARWQARIAVQTVGAKFSCIAPCGDVTSGYSLNVYPNTALAAKNPVYNPGSPNFSARTSYVDGKLAYRWSKDVDLFIEGRNLTNQTQSTTIGSAPYADGTPNLQNYYYPGRRITIGLNFRTL